MIKRIYCKGDDVLIKNLAYTNWNILDIAVIGGVGKKCKELDNVEADFSFIDLDNVEAISILNNVVSQVKTVMPALPRRLRCLRGKQLSNGDLLVCKKNSN